MVGGSTVRAAYTFHQLEELDLDAQGVSWGGSYYPASAYAYHNCKNSSIHLSLTKGGNLENIRQLYCQGLSGTVSDCKGLSGLSATVSDCQGLSGTVSDCQGLSEAAKGLLGTVRGVELGSRRPVITRDGPWLLLTASDSL